ncbi:diphosphomevalonate decarboxylase [bacterium]|nr:MAG: diphosphomevalonate decarboxylase [bacterium]
MYAAAEAQPNVALIKYWGKRNDALNLPAAGSLSITLDALHTHTTVHFDAALADDDVMVNGKRDPDQARRVGAFLNLFRTRAGIATCARVRSANDFPTSAGLASSASGFAALAAAANGALGLKLNARELSILARRGSGSAARSIFGGYVEMAAGTRDDGEDAFASPLLDASTWPLTVVIAITTHAPKAMSSRAGMRASQQTSRYYGNWIASVPNDLAVARAAIAARDFEQLAAVSEASCLAMHAMMLAARPAIIYWNGTTLDCIQRIRALQADGVKVFFTVDAGPQVKAVCLPEAAARVADALREVAGVEDVLISGLGEGARVVEDRD